MGTEIERKFLVKGDSWRGRDSGVMVRQGYLVTQEERSVRVRITGEKGYLAVKGRARGIVRPEYEYEIPLEDAVEMLNLCIGHLIEKKRYLVPHQGLTWEIDEFLGLNQGLLVAEIELESAEQEIDLPEWAGKEVSGDPRYLNANLVHEPYGEWQR